MIKKRTLHHEVEKQQCSHQSHLQFSKRRHISPMTTYPYSNRVLLSRPGQQVSCLCNLYLDTSSSRWVTCTARILFRRKIMTMRPDIEYITCHRPHIYLQLQIHSNDNENLNEHPDYVCLSVGKHESTFMRIGSNFYWNNLVTDIESA